MGIAAHGAMVFQVRNGEAVEFGWLCVPCGIRVRDNEFTRQEAARAAALHNGRFDGAVDPARLGLEEAIRAAANYRPWDPEAVPLQALLSTTGATYRQVDYWVSTGWIGGGNPGSGAQRVFTRRDVAVVQHGLALIAAGFKTGPALSIAARLADTGGVPVDLGGGLVTVRPERRAPA